MDYLPIVFKSTCTKVLKLLSSKQQIFAHTATDKMDQDSTNTQSFLCCMLIQIKRMTGSEYWR